jgi:hypothetical protein
VEGGAEWKMQASGSARRTQDLISYRLPVAPSATLLELALRIGR